MKNSKKILKYLIILSIIAAIIIFLTNLTLNDVVYLNPITTKEIQRIISPDSLVEVVVIETDGGATTSTGTSIFLVSTDGSIFKKYPIFVGDHLINLEIYWEENNFLIIKYDQGRIFEFSNFWSSANIKNWSYVVEIRLKPTTEGFSLSDSDRWLNIKK